MTNVCNGEFNFALIGVLLFAITNYSIVLGVSVSAAFAAPAAVAATAAVAVVFIKPRRFIVVSFDSRLMVDPPKYIWLLICRNKLLSESCHCLVFWQL